MKFLILAALSLFLVSCSKPLITTCKSGGSIGWALGDGYIINQSRSITETKDSAKESLARMTPNELHECTPNSVPVHLAKLCAGKDKEGCQKTLLKVQ